MKYEKACKYNETFLKSTVKYVLTLLKKNSFSYSSADFILFLLKRRKNVLKPNNQ